VVGFKDRHVTEMNGIIYKFLWKGPERAPRTAISMPVIEGGLGIPRVQDIMTAWASTWIMKSVLARTEEKSWMDFYQSLAKFPSRFDRAKNHGERLRELPLVSRDAEAAWRVFKAHSKGVRIPGETVHDNGNFRDGTARNGRLNIPTLAKAGLHRIADLWQEGKMVPWGELAAKGAPAAGMLEYNLLKKCLTRDVPRMTVNKWENKHDPVP